MSKMNGWNFATSCGLYLSEIGKGELSLDSPKPSLSYEGSKS